MVTYNMDSTVHLSKAALANVFQALELADDLFCGARRDRRRCRPARGVGIRCWSCHDGGAGGPAWARSSFSEYSATNGVVDTK
jgi:hypothetical protein